MIKRILFGFACLTSLLVSGVRADTPDPFFGQHIHEAEKGVWPTVPFGSWRLWDSGVAWPSLEPQRGQWRFGTLDRYVMLAEKNGVEILLPLGLTPVWASARPEEKANYHAGFAAEPARMEDWRNYVRTVAERYKGHIRYYDIWNEINEKGFYTGTPEQMVALTCEAYHILHEVSPEIRVVSPSLIGAGSEPDQLENLLRLGLKTCIDIVGFHFYVPHREPEEIVALIRRVQAVMKHQGIDRMPLWNTEFGWWMENGDGTPENGADKRWRRVRSAEGPAIVARSLILGRWAGLERFYWYAWDNRLMGLVEPSLGIPKPAGTAWGALTRWMNRAVPQCTEQNGVWVCRLPDADGEARRIVWKTGAAARSFAMPAKERFAAIEHLDGTRQLESPSSSRGSVALDAEPVLLISRLP